jgi:hypothetical protein
MNDSDKDKCHIHWVFWLILAAGISAIVVLIATSSGNQKLRDMICGKPTEGYEFSGVNSRVPKSVSMPINLLKNDIPVNDIPGNDIPVNDIPGNDIPGNIMPPYDPDSPIPVPFPVPFPINQLDGISTFCTCGGLIDQDCNTPAHRVNSYNNGVTEYSNFPNKGWKDVMPYDKFIKTPNYEQQNTNWFNVMPYDIWQAQNKPQDNTCTLL